MQGWYLSIPDASKVHIASDSLRCWNILNATFQSKRCTKNYIQGLSAGPGSPKFQLYQFQPGNQRIQVNKFITTLEGIMPVQQNVLPGHR